MLACRPTTKLRFSSEDTLQQVAARVHEAVLFGRGPRPSRADQETALVTRLPGPLLRFLMWIQRSLDAWNLLPSALSEPDPLRQYVPGQPRQHRPAQRLSPPV